MMRKLMVVYNPRSSQYAAISKEVLAPVRRLTGWIVGKFEVKKLPLLENAELLAKMLGDGDLVIVAGGDGTAAMVTNAVIMSGKKVTIGALGYGNFCDFARTLGVRRPVEYGDEYVGGVQEIVQKFEAEQTREIYPLEVKVDDEHWRYVPCYLSVGMAAEATEFLDSAKMRKKYKIGQKPKIFSYLALAVWYFKNRRKREFLPEMVKATDFIVMNGPRMARVMRGRNYQLEKKRFAAGQFALEKTWPLFQFMMRSMFRKVPLSETEKVKLEFAEPANVMIHAEGEYERLEAVKKIEVQKVNKVLRVVG